MLPRHLLTAGLIAAAVGACQPSAPAALSDADKAAIRSAVDAAVKIGNTAPLDAAAYVKAYYASDAVLMPPNEKTASGTDAIVAWFKALPPVSNLKLTIVEAEGAGDAAYVRGTYVFTVTPSGAAAVTDSGKYLEVWKKQADGSWRAVRDAFNSDIPLPAPPPMPAKKK